MEHWGPRLAGHTLLLETDNKASMWCIKAFVFLTLVVYIFAIFARQIIGAAIPSCPVQWRYVAKGLERNKT